MRKIIHIDMDCFYAAVEIKHRPKLKGKPIAVGGPANTRSVLTTASYEARKFGVRSAMPSSRAVRLCPDLILIPPNFELYKKESQTVREILQRFTSLIEPLSLDEAYLDVTNPATPDAQAENLKGSATLIAKEIRRLIHDETGLTASAGVAPNKFLAKVASDWRKPNGQFVIRPDEIEEFMKDLPVEKIYGVGKVTARKLHELGMKTCGDIQKHDPVQLRRWFGSRAHDLSELARGIDNRPVEPDSERKSLTVEETYQSDLKSQDECLRELPSLYEEWQMRMRKFAAKNEDSQIRGWVVKIKFHDFKATTHELSARSWPSLEDFTRLFKEAYARREEPIRLLGLGVRLGSSSSQMQNTPQLALFDATPNARNPLC